MFVGLLFGVVGSKIGGTRRMLYVAPAMGVAAGLGAFTAYDWWWVALLAGVAVLAGAGIGFGWFPALLMLPYIATFVTPVSSGKDAVVYGVIAAIATGYGLVVARRFGAPKVVEGERLPLPALPPRRSCSGSSWVPARRLAWRWDGASPTGFRSRSSCSFSTSS